MLLESEGEGGVGRREEHPAELEARKEEEQVGHSSRMGNGDYIMGRSIRRAALGTEPDTVGLRRMRGGGGLRRGDGCSR